MSAFARMTAAAAGACVVALMLASRLDAQTPAAKGPRTTMGGATDVVASGCLSKSDQPRVLVLTHLRWVRGGPKGTAAQDTRARGGQGESIKVNGAGGVDLPAHVGHQVEVTGRLINGPSRPAATSVPTEPDPSKTKRSENRAIDGTKNPAIDVTAVKVIADSCAGL